MGISASAIVSPQAEVAPDADVGPFTIIHAGTRIGPGCRIGAYCELGVVGPSADGEGLSLGAGALVRSHSVLYAGARFGPGLETGHRVTIRERTAGGTSVRIGTASDLQGDLQIGDFARLHSNVFVAKGCRIGRYAWLMPGVLLTDDPTPPSETSSGSDIGEFAVLCAGALVLPGVRIGAHAVVAAKACVRHDVPDGMLAAGAPARIVGSAGRVQLRPPAEGAAYPWPAHFTRGYPPEALNEPAFVAARRGEI